MESVKPSKNKFKSTFAKFLHIRSSTGVVPEEDGVRKLKKAQEKVKFDEEVFSKNADLSKSFDKLDEEFETRITLETFLAKLFAAVSSVKAAYAQLQHAQSPYDAEGIRTSDELIVSGLKTLSELKQCFLKKQFDQFSDEDMVLAEIQEMNSLLKTYEITGKKLEFQMRLKDSETMFLMEKLEELNERNKTLGKRLNQSAQLHILDNNLHISGLNSGHFITFLHYAVKSIRSFVKRLIEEMNLAGWDIDMAADSILPGMVYHKSDHKGFAFEHFVCREMFSSFVSAETGPQSRAEQTQFFFFQRFTELKDAKVWDFLAANPDSDFARFVRAKYLQLIQPDMESSFFGSLNQRHQVMNNNGLEFPKTGFFGAFIEMARRVWLLHCLAFSFKHKASTFQVRNGCRFSDVYMKSLSDEAFLAQEDGLYESEPAVAFTVVPGFRIGATLVQAEVYMSRFCMVRPAEDAIARRTS